MVRVPSAKGCAFLCHLTLLDAHLLLTAGDHLDNLSLLHADSVEFISDRLVSMLHEKTSRDTHCVVQFLPLSELSIEGTIIFIFDVHSHLSLFLLTCIILKAPGCGKLSDSSLVFLFAQFPYLTRLACANIPAATDRFLFDAARYLTNVVNLSLSHMCRITDSGLRILAETCTKLQTLSLGYCTKITIRGANMLATSQRHLRQLDLSGCKGITVAQCNNFRKRYPRITVMWC